MVEAAASGEEEDMVQPEAAAEQQLGRRLLRAAEAGDIAAVDAHLKDGAAASFQDDTDGRSPLMAAAKANHTEVLQRLLAAGAPWNAIDRDGRCAGDYALENESKEAVDLLINAGEAQLAFVELLLPLTTAELVLGAAQRSMRLPLAPNRDYLHKDVQYDEDKLVDHESKGVMMAWEGPLMEAHAQAVCGSAPVGDILNVGFGMGLVDTAIQRRQPRSHTIIEAHPGVYQRMLKDGWAEKPGVRILFGRWQDVIADLSSYDGIFFDTYGEYYDDLREFHSHLPKLLGPNGIYSYFNGLAADNAFFHLVSCEVARLELTLLGLETTYIPLPVTLKEDVWKEVQLKYWQLDTYFLPVCQHVDSTEAQAVR
eukprot:jgi/Chlat1/5066/Chrsp33S08958